MRNLHLMVLSVSLLSTLTFGQKTIVAEKKQVLKETETRTEKQELGTAVPVKNAKGIITEYRVALSNKQYEQLKGNKEFSREFVRLQNVAPIYSKADVVGYSFKVFPAIMDKYDKIWIGLSIKFLNPIGVLASSWYKTPSLSTVTSPLLYSPYGINKSAAAVCGTQSGVNTVFVIGGNVPVRTIDTTNNSVSQTTNSANVFDAGLVADPSGNGIYLFGGKDSGGNMLDTVYRYNGGFSQLAVSIPNASPYVGGRAGMTAVAGATGKIYIFGGYNASGLLKQVFEFNGTSITHASSANMPKALRSATAIRKGNYIYVFGGEDIYSSGSINQNVYRFDSTSANIVWETVGTLPPQAAMWFGSTTFAMDVNGEIHAIYPLGGGSGAAFGKVNEITSSVMVEPTPTSTTIGWNQNQNSFTTAFNPVGAFRYNYITVGCSGIYLIGGVYARAGFGYVNYENAVDKYAP